MNQNFKITELYDGSAALITIDSCSNSLILLAEIKKIIRDKINNCIVYFDEFIYI